MTVQDETPGLKPEGSAPSAATFNPYASPVASEEPAPAAPAPSDALRIAGAFLIAAAIPPAIVNPQTGGLALIVSGLLGGALIRGHERWKGVATLRAVLGLGFTVGGAAAQGAYVHAAFLAILSGSPLVLLWGRAGKRRTLVGAALCVVGLAYEIGAFVFNRS
jgi:hypothetical protein